MIYLYLERFQENVLDRVSFFRAGHSWLPAAGRGPVLPGGRAAEPFRGTAGRGDALDGIVEAGGDGSRD